MRVQGVGITCMFLGMFAAFAACGQTYFKWVDDHGVTHYSHQRPPGKVQTIDVHAMSPVESAPTQFAPAQPTNAQQSLDAAALQFRSQACTAAKENLKLLASGGIVLASGSVNHPAGVETATKLSSGQRTSAEAAARKNVDTYCSRG